MSDFLQNKNHVKVALHLAFIALTIAGGAFVAYHNQEKVVAQIKNHLESQVALLWDLALITDRNGADEVISAIIADCPRRVEYETLLNELGTLSKKELITVQNLYESCGSFYAERKALMVSKLEREINNTEQYVELLRFVHEGAYEAYKLKAWRELVTLEQARSSLLSDQSIIQGKIIGLLISGATPASKDVRLLVQEADEIGQLLNVRDHEIDKLRGELQS